MESLKNYNELHSHFDDGVRVSAELVVPILLELTGAKSVLDVGCGSGLWLKAFADRGAAIRGFDGAYIDRSSLLIPQETFTAADLTKPFASATADLTICLEVAEHLPESGAEGFVDSLAHTAPVIFFSAAIPGQGGMGHCNEQWPSYWKRMFEARGFAAFDIIRRKVWTVADVMHWYAQNSLLYVRESELAKYPKLAGEPREFIVNVIHPQRYLTLDRTARAGEAPSLAFLAKSVPGAVKRFAKNLVGKPTNLREPAKPPQ